MKSYKYRDEWYKIVLNGDRDEYGTPHNLFNALNEKYNFTLDPCASPTNFKVDNYYTLEDNGLLQDWNNERVFINPPYSRGNIEKWVEKAYLETLFNDAMCVLLLPNRTGMKWFRQFASKGVIYFIDGRLSYLDVNGKSMRGTNFDSMVVVFDPFTALRGIGTNKYYIMHRDGGLYV